MISYVKYIVFFIFIQTSIYAQVWKPPGTEYRGKPQMFTFQSGINAYDDDYYLYVEPGFNYTYKGIFGLSLLLPLNLLAYDKTPLQEDSKVGKLREGDYDENSDYLRILNYIWLGNYGKYTPGKVNASIFLGRITNGYIGHGTVINRYMNNLSVDKYRIGLMADVNTDYGGGQIFVDSLTDHDVYSARLYVRPLAIIMKGVDLVTGNSKSVAMLPNVADDAGRKKVFEQVPANQKKKPDPPKKDDKKEDKKPEEKKKNDDFGDKPWNNPTPQTAGGGSGGGSGSGKDEEKKKEEEKKDTDPLFNQKNWMNRFVIGITEAWDTKAPEALKFDSTGRLILDDTNNPKIDSTANMRVEGLDMEYTLLSSKYVTFTPYFDFNFIRGLDNSNGKHLGTRAKFGGQNIFVSIQPEYRMMTATYMPIYFDSYYRTERVQMNLETNIPQTKWEYMKSIDSTGSNKNGYYMDFLVSVYKYALEVIYEDNDGPNNSRIFLGIYFPIFNFALFSMYYQKKNFEGTSQAFKIDDNAIGAADLTFNLFIFSISFQDIRRWKYDENENTYKAQDEQKVLFGLRSTF